MFNAFEILEIRARQILFPDWLKLKNMNKLIHLSSHKNNQCQETICIVIVTCFSKLGCYRTVKHHHIPEIRLTSKRLYNSGISANRTNRHTPSCIISRTTNISEEIRTQAIILRNQNIQCHIY